MCFTKYGPWWQMYTSVIIIYFNILSDWLLYASEAWKSGFIYRYDDIH
jgi:hypothetical protein